MPTFNFEDGLFPSTWKNADGEPWQTTTEESDGGTFSLASNNTITDRQISSCYIIGDFDSGDFDLRYMISSEGGFDFGYVVVDGVAILDQINGSVGWTTMPTHALSAGVHIIQFVYIKDNGSAIGNDAFYIDNVALPNFTQIDSDVDYINLSSTVFSNTSGAPAVAATTSGDRNAPFIGVKAPSGGSGETVLAYTSPTDSPAGVMFFTGFADANSLTCRLFIDSVEVFTDTSNFFTGSVLNLRAPSGHYQSISSGDHLYEIKFADGSNSQAYQFYEPSFTGGGGISVTGLLNSNYMVEYSMKKNVAGQSIGAQMITISDGSDFTGTVTAEVTIDNGTKTAGGGSVTHEGEGYHSYAPTQAETNGDHIAVSFAGTGALSQTVQVYTTFPQSVDNDTAIAALNDFNPASDTVANVTLVATTTTNTDMRGTDSANTVVPPSLAQFNARSLLSANYALEVSLQTVDTNIDSILVDTGTTIPAQITALNDFNPASDTVANVTLVATTTTNTDMRGTDGANTVIPPTVIEFNARTLPSASYSQFDFAVNEVSADVTKINGVTIIGAGTSGDLWRA